MGFGVWRQWCQSRYLWSALWAQRLSPWQVAISPPGRHLRSNDAGNRATLWEWCGGQSEARHGSAFCWSPGGDTAHYTFVGWRVREWFQDLKIFRGFKSSICMYVSFFDCLNLQHHLKNCCMFEINEFILCNPPIRYPWMLHFDLFTPRGNRKQWSASCSWQRSCVMVTKRGNCDSHRIWCCNPRVSWTLNHGPMVGEHDLELGNLWVTFLSDYEML